MPYRRGLMIPTQWATPAARNSALGRRPVIAIACPDCGTEAILKPDDGFTCGYGHRHRRTDLEFDCPQDGCRKKAKIDADGMLRCGKRHEFKCN